MEVLISISEAAKVFGVPVRTIYNWIAAGQLLKRPAPAGRHGVHVDWHELADLLDSKKI